ncbi:glycosyl hydrolase 53 family protein [Desulfurococcaceae archaeon MEX13E-LK6-19]|nr:glycosyl hydrolase 53 family protein [Desulfurococcaceae archaeon MEX13E-LK6-19]
MARPRPVVCVHFKYNGVPRVSREDKLVVRFLKSLGVEYARFDLWWSDLEPDPGFLDTGAVEYYLSLLKFMTENGIEPLVILGTGFPCWLRKGLLEPIDEKYCSWLKDRLGIDPCRVYVGRTSFYGKVFEYSMVASSIALRYARWFQLGNELNNPLMKNKLDPIAFIYTLHKGLKESHRETRSRHQFKTIVNVFTCIPGWKNYVEKTCSRLRGVIDVIGIDHYPGTWCSCYNPYNWSVLDDILAIANRYNTKVAVMETGYPTNGIGLCGPRHGEEKQVKYMNYFFKTITSRYLDKLEFVSWYELLDEQHTLLNKTSYEGYFGVLKNDYRPKRSYYTLRKWFLYLKKSRIENTNP